LVKRFLWDKLYSLHWQAVVIDRYLKLNAPFFGSDKNPGSFLTGGKSLKALCNLNGVQVTVIPLNILTCVHMFGNPDIEHVIFGSDRAIALYCSQYLYNQEIINNPYTPSRIFYCRDTTIIFKYLHV